MEVFVSEFAMSKYKVTNGVVSRFRSCRGQAAALLDVARWPVVLARWSGTGAIAIELAGSMSPMTGACAFEAWSGKRLPTEAEFHWAALGTLSDEEERCYRWGDYQPDT